MRSGVTIIELIFTLVILGIMASVTTDVVRLLYERYALSREINHTDAELRRALDLIGNRLSYGVRESMIGRSETGADIRSIGDMGLSIDYPVLEWVGTAYESRLGMALDPDDDIQTGWSGFFIRTGETTIASPGSNFGIAEQVEDALGSSLENNQTVLIFEQPTLSYKDFNWLEDNRTAYYGITADGSNGDTLTFDHFEGDNAQTLYTDHYVLARSAYAVWLEESGDLMLAYNYRPWSDPAQRYDDADTPKNRIATNISTFNFRASGGVVRLVLCRELNDPRDLPGEKKAEFCRERVVFK